MLAAWNTSPGPEPHLSTAAVQSVLPVLLVDGQCAFYQLGSREKHDKLGVGLDTAASQTSYTSLGVFYLWLKIGLYVVIFQSSRLNRVVGYKWTDVIISAAEMISGKCGGCYSPLKSFEHIQLKSDDHIIVLLLYTIRFISVKIKELSVVDAAFTCI